MHPRPKRNAPNAPCPCGRDVKYKRCCGPLHRGVPAPTALALMRSRYAAYALGLDAYILETTHPDSPHAQSDRAAWAADVRAFSAGTAFEGLQIVDVCEPPPGSAEDAFVTFTARLAQGGHDATFTERSCFRRVAGRWRYLDGTRADALP